MTSTVFDLVGKYAIEKGLPWTFRCTRFSGPAKTPVDLTGSAARFEIFDATSNATLGVLTSTDGDVVLGGPAGTVVCNLSAAASLSWEARYLRYRFVFTDSQGSERVYLRGRLGLVDDQ